MDTFLVTYTLDDPIEFYDVISSELKNYPRWAKLFSNVWIIRASSSSKKIRDELSDVIEGKGKVIIINVTDSPWATYKIPNNVLDWMKENI